MKKIVYIVLVLAVLVGLAYVLKATSTTTAQDETVVVEQEVANEATDAQEAVAGEAEVVVVDEEPASEEVEAVAEEVVEENPEVTADESETIEE